MAIGGPLLLVGCGKMGGALLRGWLARGISPASITVVEPNAALLADLAAQGVTIAGAAAELPAGLRPAAIVLAVKPQTMNAVLPDYLRFARGDAVFLSIAAGRTIASFLRILGEGTPLVRSMPNTPAAVGRGITVACAGPGVDAIRRAQCDELLAAVGEVAWVDDEGLLDAVTALSGGGPAYVFLLIECLAEAGAAAGLPPDLAMRLARATVIGSGELARQSTESAAALRQDVTSPGGTTAEALNILMAADGLQPLLTKAIAAATRRSRELAD
jgi:pyrroline-5-carboxylate reductase